MKIVVLAGLYLILFSSCTPTNDVNPAPPKDSASLASSVVDTIKIYRIGLQENNYSVAKFKYDNQGRLAGIYSTDNDTTISGAIYPDTSTVIFAYAPSGELPLSYTEWISINPIISGDGHINHALSYDNPGRVLVDSETQIGGNTGTEVDHYQYGTAYIAKANSYSVDTFYLNSNNMVEHNSYIILSPAGNLGLQSQELYTYTTYANPFYIPDLSNHIGSIFPTTILSANLFSQRKNIFLSGSTRITNYTWTINTDGKVISGVGTDASTGQPTEYYWYIYNK